MKLYKLTFFIIFFAISIHSNVYSQDREFVTYDMFIKQLSDTPENLGSDRKMVFKPKEISMMINFKYNSLQLADQRSERQLLEAARALSSKALSNIRVEIEGHTDNVGTQAFNLRLSQKRADKIKEILCSKYNIPSYRIVSKGYGEIFPIASNETPKGQAMNRRVVIKRLK